MKGEPVRIRRLGGWIAAAVTVGLLAAGSATAAREVHTAGGIKYATETVRVDPHSQAVVVVECPGRTHVLGGGQTSDGAFGDLAQGETNPQDLADANTKPDDGWRIVVRNYDPTEKHNLAMTAICAKTKVDYVRTRFAANQMTQAGGSSKCPRGTHLYSGGWSIGFSIETNSSFPFDGADADTVRDDRWQVFIDNSSSSDAKAFVYAVCGERFPKYKKTVVQAEPGQTTGLHVRCPNDTFAYGGGEENSGGLNEANVSDLGPFGSPAPSRGWHPSVDNLTADPFTLEGFAICGKAFG
jgi:hypothetical protein